MGGGALARRYVWRRKRRRRTTIPLAEGNTVRAWPTHRRRCAGRHHPGSLQSTARAGGRCASAYVPRPAPAGDGARGRHDWRRAATPLLRGRRTPRGCSHLRPPGSAHSATGDSWHESVCWPALGARLRAPRPRFRWGGRRTPPPQRPSRRRGLRHARSCAPGSTPRTRTAESTGGRGEQCRARMLRARRKRGLLWGRSTRRRPCAAAEGRGREMSGGRGCWARRKGAPTKPTHTHSLHAPWLGGVACTRAGCRAGRTPRRTWPRSPRDQFRQRRRNGAGRASCPAGRALTRRGGRGRTRPVRSTGVGHRAQDWRLPETPHVSLGAGSAENVPPWGPRAHPCPGRRGALWRGVRGNWPRQTPPRPRRLPATLPRPWPSSHAACPTRPWPFAPRSPAR